MSEPNGNTLTGFGKDPLVTSHGDALLDQNFQSLKSKEVRDSMSPTHELKFHSMTLTQPNTTGWDVQTSSEVSPDGRAYRTETLAKTDGVEKLNGGGVAEFKGRNEQRSSASHQGDDKNYVKKAAESSNTHLQEKVVFGDESNGRTEMKMSSTTSSSTSKFVSSSSTVEYDDDAGTAPKPRYLLDNQQTSNRQREQLDQHQRDTREHQQREEQRAHEQRLVEQRLVEQRLLQQQQQQQREEQRIQEERYSESREQTKSTRNVETQQHIEENKRYVDMDKASPEYQRHVQHLMSQPGEIISNTVEYPKPNVKMITTVKRLPDGTIVKNKRYETEQVNPSPVHDSVRQHQTQTQTQTKNQQQQQQQRVHNTQSQPRDVVDNVDTVRRTDAEELIKQESYSSVKKSSRRFSTETTSETIEEYDDRAPHQSQPQKLKAPSPGRQDFGTPGYTSAQPSNPIQEFPNQRPTTPSRQSPSTDFSTHGFPSVKSNKPTQEFISQRPATADGGEEIIVVKSEKSRNVKQSSTTQRTTETQYVGDDHAPIMGTPSWEQPASPRRAPVDDYSTHGFPSVRDQPQPRSRPDQPDGEVVHHSTTVSRKQSATHKSNTEHIIETQVDQDFDVEPEKLQQPRRAQPLQSQPPQSPRRDYTGTQGFPSARSPTRNTNVRSPVSKSPPRKSTPAAGSRTPGRSTTETTTTTMTRRQLQKEREVDAAHRAFAASLRSSSPADSTTSTGSHHQPHPRRDSNHQTDHQRLTPRSSISSNKTYRRDGREGSHDSHAPSESSRISSTTVTRHVGIAPTSPTTTKSVGKHVVTKLKTTRNVQGSNETIDLMPQRSPKSPTTKATTTTTTTTTTSTINKPVTPTTTAAPAAPPTTAPAPVSTPIPKPTPTSAPETSNVTDNQSQYTYATTKPADIFSLPPTSPTINNNNNNNNEPTLTTTTTSPTTTTKNNNNNNNSSDSEILTKTKLSTNDAVTKTTGEAVNEPPCVRRNYYKLGPSDKDATTEETPSIATAVTSTETVAATTPKSPRPQHPAPRPSHDAPHRYTPTSNRKPYHNSTTPNPDIDNDEPTPARRSSKSPSVERRTMQRETTFETTSVERDFLPEQVAQIDDQIVIDESTIEVKQRTIPKPKGESPRQSPEKQLPGTDPSKISPEKQIPVSKESPRQSPEKQLPELAPWKTIPKEAPEKQLPETVQAKPRESPRQSPEKQIPKEPLQQGPKESPRSNSPVKQQPELAPWKVSPRDTSENQMPTTVSKGLPRQGSPEKQLPKESSPERFPIKPKELPRQSSEKQLPVKPKDSAEPEPRKTDDKPRQSAERHFPIGGPTKTRDVPQRTPDNQQPTQFPEDAIFRSTVTQTVKNTTKNLNEEFISNESVIQPTRKAPEYPVPKGTQPENDDIDKPKSSSSPETPDGGFISKSPQSDQEDSEPKPTYRKKGLSRRETFEDRCRKILGMEEDGDTQGNYVPKPEGDEDNDDTDSDENTTVVQKTETFEFKIEDCPDDDDEDDNKPRRVTETIVVRTQPVIKVEEPLSEPESDVHHHSELTVDVTESEQIDTLINTEKVVTKKTSKAGKQPKEEVEPRQVTEKPIRNEPRSSPRKHPKDDAETITVDEEITVVTTKHISKDDVETRPTAGKPSRSTPHQEKEQRPVSGSYPKEEVEPRPAAGKPSWNEPRSSPGKHPKDDAETITVDEETTVVTTKRISKDDVETRPAAGKPSWSAPKDEKEPRPVSGKYPKDEVKRRPVARDEPRSYPDKHPKDDAETVTVDEETTVVTTKRISKDDVETRPAAGKPSWSTPKHEKEPRPVSGKYPKEKVEPRPAGGKHPKDEEEPRPATGKPSWDDKEPSRSPNRHPQDNVESTTVDKQTTVVTTKRTSRDEFEQRPAAGKPSWSTPKHEKEPRPASGRYPKEELEPRPAAGKQPKKVLEPRSPSGKQTRDEAKTITVDEETTIIITKRPSKSPSPERKTLKSPSPTRNEPSQHTEATHFITEKIIDCNGKNVVEKISKTTRPVGPTDGTKAGPKRKQPLDSEPEELQPKPESKKTPNTKTDTERRNSRTTKISSTTVKQPVKESPQKTSKSPRKESLPKREPAKRDSLVEETRTTTTTTTTRTTQNDRKSSEPNTSPSIKDRLRSSPRKQKPHPDDVDGQSSSPDTSPSRVPSERRRSSNISVHTEIIIDHTSPKTLSPKTERKMTVPARKIPVTERKESAPVPRVTRRDKDKVTRSTSENVIKVVNGKPKTTPEMSTLNPTTAQRPNDRTRPSKCFTTKTINLSEQLINSDEMENVIIDIQHAKSSREPSPDRIVPTPVPAELDTGKPRYPDVVQEPDDEPKKKPVITNIPIFEEEANAYVGCQISEIRNANGIEADIHDNPTVEAPKSLDYTSTTTTNGVNSTSIDVDECLLSVHEKVSKFTHSAEQVKQPKTSVPFSRQFDEHAKVSASDECLLSIDEKVDRFLKTAENITKQPITPTREIERPSFEDIDEELRQDDCILSVSQKVNKFIDTAEKLAPTAPQKSPRLVANIERHISRQSEPESEPQLDQESEPEQPSDSELEEQRITTTTTKRVERLQQPESDDDLQPMSKHHTTKIELKRQKDILNRPSVFGQRPMERPVDRKPTSLKQPRGGPSTALITEERRSYRNQTVSNTNPTQPTPTRSTTAPRKPSLEKQPRGKPITNIPTDTEVRKSSIHSTTSSTSNRREHITQQQWVVSDVDVDVEEVGPAPSYHSESPKAKSPARRTTPTTKAPLSSTTTTTVKTTTEETGPKTTQNGGSPRPTSPSRRTTSTTFVKSTSEEHSVSPRPTSPGRRTTTTNSTTTTKAPLNSTTVVKASTEHSTTKHTTRTHSPTNQQPTTLINLDSSPDSPTDTHVQPLLDRSRPTQVQPGRSVASRRNIFEKQSPSPTSEPSGRRPSYMDHTKSSLEHIRRDSLEINKTHYSRKSSIDDDSIVEPRNPNAAVKFDVPKRSLSRSEPSEDIDIEQIFDLVQLEQLLETVSSYELRRRIRAQLRLIRKNMINAGTSITSTTTTTTTSTTQKRAPEQLQPRGGSSSHGSTPSRSPQLSRRTPEQPRDRSCSPVSKTSTTNRPKPEQPLEPRDRSRSPDGKSVKERTTITTTTTRRTEPDSTTGHGKPPVKPRERSASPAQTQSQTQTPRRRSPTSKTGSKNTTTTVTTRTTTSNHNGSPRSVQSSPDRRGSKPSPIWADRSKVLRGATTASPAPRKGSNSSTTSNTTISSGKIARTSTSTTSSSSTTTSSSKRREEDSITSSYGVGPTDENGLPLFGIRALKKKTQPAVCETKQEVTGYVIEEQFYADDKSPPRHERKELIYSSNPQELATLQQKLEQKTNVDANTKLQREFKQITGPMDAIDTVSTRRGSSKEINERFIRKESTASNQSQTLVQHELVDEETEDSESNDVCSVIEVEMEPQLRETSSSTTRTSSSTRSFLNTSGEERLVSSVDDVLERMRNADNVVEPGDSSEDREARALLNKFLGASVIMQGVESMLPVGQRQQQQSNRNSSNSNSQAVKTTRISSSYSNSKSGNSSNTNNNTGNNNNNRKTTTTITSSAPVTRTTCDIEEIWDEQLLRQLLEQASTYEERRKIRARLRELMAEREAQHKQQSSTTSERTETKSKDGGAVVTTTTTKVTTRTVSGSAATKNISPLAKFKQLDKAAAQQQAQKSSPTTSTPTTPGGSAQPYFKFTDPALNARAATVKDQLLQWCQHKTQEYENVQISNFSSSWSDGLAFCALIHHFLPDAFDYSKLTKQTRRHNFEMAFTVADEKAGIAPLLDVEDMVEMSRPDWKCVFVYVQSIYRRFRNCQ